MRVLDVLDRNSRLYGERAAVTVVGGGSWTYLELHQRVRSVASGLAELGVAPGDRVALIAPNGITFFDIYLACACLGAIAVPINTTLAVPEAEYIIEHAEPSVIIVDGPFAALAAGAPAGTPVIDVESASYRRLLKHESIDGALRRSSEDDVGIMLYTSGTTGRPKGVCLTQRALMFNAMTVAVAQQLLHSDVFLSSTPLYHAASGTRVFTMLLDGQTHVVLPAFDVDVFLRALEEYQVTTTVVVPTQLQRMLDSSTRTALNLDPLRLLVYGAAPTSLGVIERATKELDCGLFQGYGLTEAVTNLTALTADDHRTGDSDLLRSCGRPVAGVDLDLVDDSGAPVPHGEVGEIIVRTEKLMDGYWKDPAATSAVIVEGWLHTGDLARFGDDGFLYIVGRAKDMLISGGVNIYPSEVEEVLQAHPAVASAAVVGARHDEWGEVPVAFIVARDDTALDVSELRTWCAARLSRLKIPRWFDVVDDLPRTSTGKVRKTELQSRAEQRGGESA